MPDDEPDPGDLFHDACNRWNQAMNEADKASEEAEARLHRSCPELRGEAFHKLLRKDEALRAKFQAVGDAMKHLAQVMSRKDVMQWAGTTLPPGTLENFIRSCSETMGTMNLELEQRRWIERIRTEDSDKDVS
jgi:hypothetical protein